MGEKVFYLAHSAKGKDWKNHQYTSKEPKKNGIGWIYYYGDEPKAGASNSSLSNSKITFTQYSDIKAKIESAKSAVSSNESSNRFELTTKKEKAKEATTVPSKTVPIPKKEVPKEEPKVKSTLDKLKESSLLSEEEKASISSAMANYKEDETTAKINKIKASDEFSDEEKKQMIAAIKDDNKQKKAKEKEAEKAAKEAEKETKTAKKSSNNKSSSSKSSDEESKSTSSSSSISKSSSSAKPKEIKGGGNSAPGIEVKPEEEEKNPFPERQQEKDQKQSTELDDETLTRLANLVIRGLFGNGAERKEALGDNYDNVQQKVNELLRKTSNKNSVDKLNQNEGINDEKKKKVTNLRDRGYSSSMSHSNSSYWLAHKRM